MREEILKVSHCEFVTEGRSSASLEWCVSGNNGHSSFAIFIVSRNARQLFTSRVSFLLITK